MKQLKFGVFDIILAVVVVISIGLNVYAYTGIFGGDDAGGQLTVTAPPQAVVTPKSTEAQPVTPPPETTPEQTPTPEPETSEQAPTETPAPAPEPQKSYEDYKGYADGEERSIGDFFWYTEDVKYDGLPEGRTVITDFSEIVGYWKAYTEDAHVMSEDDFLKWFNVEISGKAKKVKFTYHTKNFFGFDAGNTIDISSWDGESYNGSFSDGQLVVGDITAKGVEITIMQFYSLNGKQYALGEIAYISGEKENIALVRP